MTGHVIPPFTVNRSTICGQGIKELGHVLQFSNNGWVDHELFSYFLAQDITQNALPYHPQLLLLDGHSMHFEPKSLQVAKDNNTVIFYLPHTTHIC